MSWNMSECINRSSGRNCFGSGVICAESVSDLFMHVRLTRTTQTGYTESRGMVAERALMEFPRKYAHAVEKARCASIELCNRRS